MRIIIFKEKHGDRYFDASTPEKLQDACYAVIKDRIDAQWYSLKKPVANVPEKPQFTVEMIKSWPDGEVKTLATRQWKDYQQSLRFNECEMKDYELLKKIKDGDKLAASQFVKLHQNGEYERYEIVDVEEPK